MQLPWLLLFFVLLDRRQKKEHCCTYKESENHVALRQVVKAQANV
jgi:hypothetical protein